MMKSIWYGLSFPIRLLGWILQGVLFLVGLIISIYVLGFIVYFIGTL